MLGAFVSCIATLTAVKLTAPRGDRSQRNLRTIMQVGAVQFLVLLVVRSCDIKGCIQG